MNYFLTPDEAESNCLDKVDLDSDADESEADDDAAPEQASADDDDEAEGLMMASNFLPSLMPIRNMHFCLSSANMIRLCHFSGMYFVVSVLGFEIEQRVQLDKMAYQLIVPNPTQPLERDGVIKSWQLYAKNPGRVMLMVSR